jgi:hypothetical protein
MNEAFDSEVSSLHSHHTVICNFVHHHHTTRSPFLLLVSFYIILNVSGPHDHIYDFDLNVGVS